MKRKTETDLILEYSKKIHMIGIGGSGMCPIAEILCNKGYKISGSDNNKSDTLSRVEALGIEVVLGHSADNIKDPDLVIYSAAIMQDNPELKAAREKGIPCLERSVVLGALTRSFENVIAVSGTHGKTTTTSMITQILIQSGLDPSAVIGGKLPLINANGIAGKSETMVCEACEFVDTFLKLSPDVSVILNIDEDHLDYFKTVENLINSFTKFAEQTSRLLIVNGDDPRTLKAVKTVSKEIITFGFDEQNNYYPKNIVSDKGCFAFDLYYNDQFLQNIRLSVPGRHNILNALAAAAASIDAGASARQAALGLADFRGAGRRFEILASLGGITVADDYAHHPAELKVTLETAKTMGYKRIVAIFQPFTFSRTSMLLSEFGEALKIADEVILTDIMGSREVNTFGISTEDLAVLIPGCVWFKEFDEVAGYAAETAREGDLLLTLGCGDVYKAAHMIIEKLKNRAKQ